MKNRDEYSTFFKLKISYPVAISNQLELNQHHILSACSVDWLSGVSPKISLMFYLKNKITNE